MYQMPPGRLVQVHSEGEYTPMPPSTRYEPLHAQVRMPGAPRYESLCIKVRGARMSSLYQHLQ